MVDWGKWLALGAGAGLAGIIEGLLRGWGVGQWSTDTVSVNIPAGIVGVVGAWAHGRPELKEGWQKNLVAGLAIGSIGTLAEDAFEGIVPVTHEQKVYIWYKVALQRAPDPQGFQYWVGRLKAGEDETKVKRDFLTGAAKELGTRRSSSPSSPQETTKETTAPTSDVEQRALAYIAQVRVR